MPLVTAVLLDIEPLTAALLSANIFTAQPFKINLGESLDAKYHSYWFWSVIAEACICVFIEYIKKSMGWHPEHFVTLVAYFIPNILLYSPSIADLEVVVKTYTTLEC